MKISDARNILNENKGKHLYDVIIPSTGEKIPFAPMTVGHHKSVAKMAINDESNFDKFLCALLLNLSDEKIQLDKVSELDKMAMLYQIKQHNSTEPLKVTLTCPEPECGHDFIGISSMGCSGKSKICLGVGVVWWFSGWVCLSNSSLCPTPLLSGRNRICQILAWEDMAGANYCYVIDRPHRYCSLSLCIHTLVAVP